VATIWETALALHLMREDANADDGTFLGVRYTPAYDEPPVDLVQALADLIMLLYSAEAEAAEPNSWRLGGAISSLAWMSLLHEANGGYPKLRPWLGEALAWWHERSSLDTIVADRPAPYTSMPVIDSLTLSRCGDRVTVRAVQAKVTDGAARPRTLATMQGFAKLQSGEYDEAWCDAIRRLRGELKVNGIEFNARDHYDDKRHFTTSVGYLAPWGRHPTFDYSAHVDAEPHGRTVALFESILTPDLVSRVRAEIAGRLL
jgi:hypothetical protein